MKAIVGVVVGLVIGLVLGLALGPMVANSVFRTDSEDRDSQIVTAVTLEEQVVLLSLGILGLHDRGSSSELWGFEIPWSNRTSILEYSFTAKLGIEGGDVTIEKTGDDAFLLSIPEFIFIGHEGGDFRMAIQDHGALSWITPKVDTAELITEILNGDTELQYVESNVSLLKEQAEVFYRGILTSIDPDITVEFEFRN